MSQLREHVLLVQDISDRSLLNMPLTVVSARKFRQYLETRPRSFRQHVPTSWHAAW